MAHRNWLLHSQQASVKTKPGPWTTGQTQIPLHSVLSFNANNITNLPLCFVIFIVFMVTNALLPKS